MIKKIFAIKLIFLTLISCVPAIMNAVTQKEMEEARTIAAKAYIRYVNDGSGYLDDLNPKTIDELQGMLKPKEKENIKVFLAIPVPSDYASWDKEKLVEYWAGTAFKDKGLVEKGRGGRIRARSQINKMTISAPQAETTPASIGDVKESETTQPSQATDSLNNKVEEQIKPEPEEEGMEDMEYDLPEAYNYTWVYIMILGILVAIVIALVVYAANVMKKNAAMQPSHNPGSQEIDSEIIEKYENALSDKDYEISMIRKKLEASEKNNNELKATIEKLNQELVTLKRSDYAPRNEERLSKPVTTSQENPRTLRTIYLGRANSRQIFVRADRSFNAGNSIFVLDTNDGFTGTFKVADNAAAWSLALSNPMEYLANACIGRDLEDTSGMSRIITDSAGTAIFEGGCWRVLRKAKISYER